MIPSITEVNFPSYATLHQATVSLQEMGERTITTQVRIDGSVTPSFEGWELRFKGERFVLPTRTPQAAKDNTTKNALVDLTFQSWAIEQLKHYFFVSLSEYETGKFIPDQYNASVILPLESFVQLFNRVLQYYFGTGIRMDLFGAGTGIYSTQPVSVEINKTYIWDVLIKFYELFDVRWYIEYEQATGAYVIKVGYAADAITDHDFEYGYNGGLLKFERNIQDADVRNILLGRGGEKNLPYRYFKLQDPQNQEWAADPDAIPELANIYFDRLRDINFRWYVRGWMQNSHRDTSWDATHTFPQYTESQCPAEHLFAFRLGKTDAKFNPVEYVKDDASITKYGERWGAVEDNDEVFPTIKGMTGTGIGRVDECVDVSDIVTDDIQAAVTEAATVRPVSGEITITKDFSANEQKTDVLRSEQFTIPSGSTGNLSRTWLNPIAQDGAGLALVSVNTALSSVKAVRVDNGTEYDIDTPGGFPAGTYYAKITVVVKNYNTSSGYSNVTYGLQSLDLTVSTPNTEAWKPTFDIWVKNIWETTQGQSETDERYAARVWEPILGDRVGNEAKLVFSDGFMSVSQDYEFTIASYPVKDRSKSINGVQSEWKITLFKSDAEFKATGLYVPNATTGGKPAAGDHFFFIGIDMPFLYVTRAEELLNGSTMTPVVNKTAALSDLADVQPTWVISLDKVRVHTLEDGEYGQTLAERLSAGATVRIKDSRFTGGQTLTLYVKSITYTWNEPTTGNPYLVPDIEVVLSDTVLSAEGTVTRVANELNVVKTTYAKSADIESTVRAVGNALFLKKTGESDRSSSPTQFASKVTSMSFRQGDIGGKGWGFYDEEPAKVQAVTRATRAAATETEEKGNSVLEIDKLVVRKEMRVNSLVANQIAYVGGRQIVSAAAIECTQVVDDQAGYYCYFNQKQGTVANLFVVGDFAMGQMFDPNNLEVRYYKARVDEIGSNYILLSKTVKDGDGVPAVGDTIVQHGHESNTARQFVIVRDVIGGGYERMLSGLDAVDAEGDEYYFAGKLNSATGPRWFVGDAAGEYAEWVNGRLNIKGTLVVRNADGTYQAMTDYMAGVDSAMDILQAQIDGQIQSWASTQAPSAQTEPFPQYDPETEQPVGDANYPANGWATTVDKNKHVGDIYTDDTTGQAWRYSAGFYWVRITDEEAAAAMAIAQQAAAGVAGLQYLKAATNNGATLVSGGLILSNLMALGQTVSQQFQVTAGINGIMNAGRTRLGGGLAAWFGGDISDKDDLDQGVTAYAKSVFRFDGSGYLAGGNIHWDQNGYGGIPGITWSRPAGAQNDVITISAGVVLEQDGGTDSTVTDLLTAVQNVTGMFQRVAYTVNGQTRYYIKVNAANYDGIAAEGFGVFAASANFTPGGGGGGADLGQVWQSLQNAGSPVEFATNLKIAQAHLPALSGSGGLTASYGGTTLAESLSIGIASGYKLPTTTEWGNKADASALAGYLPLSGGTMTGGNISWNTDSRGVYLYNGCGIEKWAGYGPSLVTERNSSTFEISLGSDRTIRYAILHSGNYSNYALPLSGGTMNNTNVVTNLNADLLDGQHGSYYAAASSLSNYLPLSGGTIHSATGPAYLGFAVNGTSCGEINVNSSQLYIGHHGSSYPALRLRPDQDYPEFRYGGVNYEILHSGNYSTYALPIVGGKITGGSSLVPLTINTTAVENRLRLQIGDANKADFMWDSTYGASMLDLVSGNYISVGANGAKYNGSNTIYHSGNSNLTTVPWSASSLTLAGPIYIEQGQGIYCLGSGSYRRIYGCDSSNVSSQVHNRMVSFAEIPDNDADDAWQVRPRNGSYSDAYITVRHGGNVLIGATSLPSGVTAKLHVSGVINASTGVQSPGYGVFAASASSSDARLKDGIVSISPERAWSVLMQLKPREWTWNANYYQAGKRGAGLVAQEVEPVLPFSVLNDDKYLHLTYDVMHGFEIAGLQDLMRRVAALEKENEQLKARLNN